MTLLLLAPNPSTADQSPPVHPFWLVLNVHSVAHILRSSPLGHTNFPEYFASLNSRVPSHAPLGVFILTVANFALLVQGGQLILPEDLSLHIELSHVSFPNSCHFEADQTACPPDPQIALRP
jgi:hypothetical protein